MSIVRYAFEQFRKEYEKAQSEGREFTHADYQAALDCINEYKSDEERMLKAYAAWLVAKERPAPRWVFSISFTSEG